MGLFCCSSASSKRSKHSELDDSETPRNDYRYQNNNQNDHQARPNPYNDVMVRDPLPNNNNNYGHGGNNNNNASTYQQNINRYAAKDQQMQHQYGVGAAANGGGGGGGSSAGRGMPPLRNPRAAAAEASKPARNDDVFPELATWRLDETEVLLTRKISTGAFGVVWLGHYHGQPVAVKRMIDGGEEVGFSREIQTMARLVHPKIVRFIGCTWSSVKDLSAVTEFMDGGDVRTLLENRKIDLTWDKQKISIATDVAEALAYMHSKTPKVIHRDLKSRNVLLNAQLVAKLSDFGLSRNRTYEETLTAGVGTVRWTAPEVMLGENYSEQADVYSFGVVLSELDTREIPFEEKGTSRSGAPGAPDMAIVIKVAKGELRPTFAPDCPEAIHKIAKACLQFDPALRPRAASVVRMLNDAKAQLLMQ